MKSKKFSLKAAAGMMAAAVVAIAGMTAMSSCGNKNVTPEDVANKIEAKEALSDADYSTMIDYCGDYAKEAQPYFDIINAAPNDSTRRAEEAASNLADLYAKYKYLDTFRTQLDNTDITALDKSNQDKINKLSEYSSFPLPAGAGAALENPDVVGDIVDMPESDTSAVIATGDGEAVDVPVKK